jgi:hypothetical protein
MHLVVETSLLETMLNVLSLKRQRHIGALLNGKSDIRDIFRHNCISPTQNMYLALECSSLDKKYRAASLASPCGRNLRLFTCRILKHKTS